MAEKVKRALVHPHTFVPDQVSTGYLYGDIVEALVKSGMDVTVITTIPHYNYQEDFSKDSKRSGLFRIRNHKGAKVYHVFQVRKGGLLLRGFFMLYFHLLFFFKALSLKKFDVILTGSPPITSGFMAGMVAALTGARAIYNVQEIYPDVLIKQGNFNNPLLIKALKWIEKKTYQLSTKVVTIDETFSRQIQDRLPAEKLMCIPNFIDVNLYKPYSGEPSDRLAFLGKFVIGYVGNMGEVQNWEAVIEAVEILKTDERFHFLLVGGGPKFEYLSKKAKDYSNLNVWPYQERHLVPPINSRIDLHLISMNRVSDYDGLPSKVFAILASERPILAATNQDSPLANLVVRSGLGTVVKRDDGQAIADGIVKVEANYFSAEELKKGRDFVTNGYSVEIVTQKYVELIQSL